MSEAQQPRGLAAIRVGETPSPGALLAAVGGVRGVIESLLPGFAFLVIFAITKQLVPSVIGPVVVAAGFLVVRFVQRSTPLSAVAGVVGVALSAGFALWTGNVNDNFVLGFVINAAGLAIAFLSILLRRPLVGVVIGIFSPNASEWRRDDRMRRAAYAATWVWVGLFGVRLLVEVPLYFASATEALASAKLVLGLPFYAAALWFTWLLVRRPRSVASEADAGV